MAVKVQALWDMEHACDKTDGLSRSSINLSFDVWRELLKTEDIHEPHWQRRNNNRVIQMDDWSLDEYYEFHQNEHNKLRYRMGEDG